MEVWKTINGFEDYEISNYGNVISKNCNRKRNIKLGLSNRKNINNQYLHFVCSLNNVCKDFYPHKLVCEYFVGGYFDGSVVDHKDGNRLNNHYSNLHYVTRSKNILKSDFKNKNSNYPYVYKSGNNWKCCVTINKKNIHLGVKKTQEEAYLLYKNYASTNLQF